MGNIFSEMQRRNVFKTVLFYAAACWLLIQISETVLPIFGVPDWVLRFLVMALAAGFIPVILLSWIYEITPQGIKKEQDVSAGDSISDTTGRKIGIATVGLLIAIVALSVFGPQLSTDPVDSPSLSEPFTSKTLNLELVQGVAVLPFDNVSGSEENAFFATGVQEDILTHLSSVKDLRVISRTSVKGYQGSSLQIPEIAKQLGVSHLVEGSVRRAGNKVRVTVQLIDGVTDEHIWAENYDRTLADIFVIQSEVAQKIVSMIKQKLTSEELVSLAQNPTTNTKAYELFHRAKATVKVGVRSPTAMTEPIRLMKLAVEADPDYLQAWLNLTEYCGYAVWWDAPEYTACIKDAVEAVERLAPNSFELELAKGIYSYRSAREYQQALEHLKIAKKGLPNSVLAWTYLSYVARRVEDWDLAEEALLKVTQLDPLAEQQRVEYIATLGFSGDWRRAILEAEQLRAKFPEWQLTSFYLAELKLNYLGDLSDYRTAIESMPIPLRWNHGNVFLEGVFDNDDERVAWIKSMAGSSPGAPARIMSELGLLALVRGDEEGSEVKFKAAYEAWRSYPLGSIDEQGTYLLIITARSRARGGDLAGARAALKAFNSRLAAQPDQVLRNEMVRLVVDTYVALNESALAWQEVERALDSGYGLTAWDLKYDLVLKHFFEDLPEYQELVSALVVGQPPKANAGSSD